MAVCSSFASRYMWWSILLFCSVLGCGEAPKGARPSGSVQATVTYGSNPLPAGSQVQFLILDSMNVSSAAIDENGIANLPRVDVGKNKVMILPPPIEGEPGNFAPAKEYKSIPEKFRSSTTTPLEFEVKEGENKLAIDLKE